MTRSCILGTLGLLAAGLAVVAPVRASGQAPASPTAASPGSPLTPETAAAVSLELRNLYRGQRPDGGLVFDGESAYYADHPVMAAMCRDALRARPDAALASQSVSALTRYYARLFSTRDTNHDFLVETDDAAGDVDEEDVGFNALLANDLVALAQLEVALRRPFEGMRWYEAAQSMEDALVSVTWDPRSGFFFPLRRDGRKLYRPLSTLPLLFPGRVGENHAATLIREYLLSPVPRAPQSPYDILAGPWPAGLAGEALSARLLAAEQLTDVLAARGYPDDAATFRTQAAQHASQAVAALNAAHDTAPAHLRYLLERLEGRGPGPEESSLAPLDIFLAAVAAAGQLDDVTTVRLGRDVDVLRRTVSAPPDARPDADSVRRALATVRHAVTLTREQIRQETFFTQQGYRALSGFDPKTAGNRLLDDVLLVARDAENRLFQDDFAPDGLRVGATLLRDRAGPGSVVQAKWMLGAYNRDVAVTRARVVLGDAGVDLLAKGDTLRLGPGRAPVELRSRIAVPGDRVDALVALPLSLEIETAAGRPGRWNVLRSIYVDRPVRVTVDFPRGRLLESKKVPIDVAVSKHTGRAITIRYEWYSPTGLRPVTGRAGEFTMPARQDSAVVRLEVPVPHPCRPGRFPITVKFLGDGADLGTVQAVLYRPYEWIVIGPFSGGKNALTTPAPPERAVDLSAVYSGARGDIAWRKLPPDATGNLGEIQLGRVVRSPGIVYLYTVVESPFPMAMPVTLGVNAPAAVFVNGERALTTGGSARGDAATARVNLAHGLNTLLVKVAADSHTQVFFNIGDDKSDASYALGNNLRELVDDYDVLAERDTHPIPDPTTAQKLITLHYRAPEARTVAVIGSFNGWSPDRSPMRRLSSGEWEIVLSLEPGRYAYRFLVDDRKQVVDPASSAIEPDGYGGENSVMVVE